MNPPLRVAFAGTPEFAARALESILDAGYEVPLVLTQPDRPAGRGMKLTASAVKQLALARGIEVDQPEKLRTDDQRSRLAACAPDVLVVAAYGLILPQAVLDLPRLGCINIHASLLPRWRGAAPIQRAILAGDSETGVCIMQMDAGLDTGAVLHRESLPITADDTAASLHDKLAALGARLIVEALAKSPLTPTAQPGLGATYAAKIDKAEAWLDWRLPALQLARQVRAFNPFPGAAARVGGGSIKVWRADVATNEGALAEPGTVVAADKSGIVVACGQGALRLTEVQKAGGKRLPVAQFLAGTMLAAGIRFDPAP